MVVELNKSAFNHRVQRIYQGWRDAANNDDYSSIDGADGLLLIAGDPAPQDEPTRLGTSIQQWLLGYEFPSTLILFAKDKISILCSASKGVLPHAPLLPIPDVSTAKILSQLQDGSETVPIEILTTRAATPNNSLQLFFSLYTSKKRVGVIGKEVHQGKLIDEWRNLAANAEGKRAIVDMSPAFLAFMAIENEEEEEMSSVSLAD
ncbi:FACT complex subunit SPT16 N-terminal lobe domain-containing protein [Mycena amicta]|nr:FACT complex subunit SPT16 N-terminal lobe domain-containing protein [Mycena amicta]